MAKRRPAWNVVEMADAMGLQLSRLRDFLSSRSRTALSETPGRLFSNLRPVSTDLSERTEKEYEEFLRTRKRVGESSFTALEQGRSKTVVYHDDSVQLGHGHDPGFYRFPLDINFGFGLTVALLFSEFEASHVLSTAKLHERTAATRASTPTPAATFLSLLPLEIRQTIYKFALPRGEWRMVDDEDFARDNFPRGIGEPSGFYYPLSKDLSILRVNKQIRREALPFAYRRTTFCLDNLESAIKFLIAVGHIGRENIEMLRLAWESTSEPTDNWDMSSDQRPEWLPGKLPSRNTSTCIQLLKQCKRLRHLSLRVDSDLIQEMGPDAFTADAGMPNLCTLQWLKRVENQEWGMVSLEPSSLAKWLRGDAREVDEQRNEDKDGLGVLILSLQERRIPYDPRRHQIRSLQRNPSSPGPRYTIK